MKTPLVSIIIPSYNAALTLGECIESVLIQRYPAIEIIVVDDGSTDNTAEVVKRFGERLHYIFQANGGLASARNTGHRAARGDFVAWLDADDISEPDRIALQAEYLATHDSVGLVSSNFSAFNEEGVIAERYATQYYSMLSEYKAQGLYNSTENFCPTGTWLTRNEYDIPAYHGYTYHNLVWGNFIHPPTVMFRRSLIDAVGPLDPDIPNSEDWEFFIRASRISEFGYLDLPLLQYRRHSAQLSDHKNFRQHVIVWIAVQKKILAADPKIAKRHPSSVNRQLCKWYTYLAYEEAKINRKLALFYILKSLMHSVKSLAPGIESQTLLSAFVLILFPKTVSDRLRNVIKKLRNKKNALVATTCLISDDFFIGTQDLFPGLVAILDLL